MASDPLTHTFGPHAYLRLPVLQDARPFLAAARASRSLHQNWVRPPQTVDAFASYVERYAEDFAVAPGSARQVGWLLCRRDDHVLLGVFNLSEIVRGAFQSAYLGYYAFSPNAGQGYMAEGLALVLRMAFRTLKLHRIEANIQPQNQRSVALVRAAGFAREGYSRRYVKIAGRWRDHERWAMLSEDWRR